MLNIIIPMAGRGSRFSAAGYRLPKPLIPVNGVPMVRLVIENVKPRTFHKFIFVCQNAHIDEFGLAGQLQAWAPGCDVIGIDGITDGAACTVLKARDLIDNDDALMIANSDQFVDFAIDAYLDSLDQHKLDGLIMTMQASDPKWSYVSLDDEGLAVQVVEKSVISPHATVGIYNFRHGRDFVRAAESMIAQDLRSNGEFYVAPVYNELIADGLRIGVHDIGSEAEGMYGLGIPSDLEAFLALPLCARVTEALK